MDSNRYLLVFDTNVLYVKYENIPNFSDFSFSGTFNSFLDEIEELDIYDTVSVSIPDIVWLESKQQNIEAYNKKIEEVQNAHRKTCLPFHKLIIDETKNYEDYLDLQIENYKEGLRQRQVKVESLKLPSRDRYGSIIKRALEKRPPFEGKDKKSDKGFKDTLLWESIIEYKKQNRTAKIILYTNDAIFNNELQMEFKNLFDDEILIFGSKNENLLHDLLHSVAISKDATYPISVQESNIRNLRLFLFSKICSDKLTIFCSGLLGTNFYVSLKSVEVVSVNNIKDIERDEVFYSDYEVALTVRLFIETRDNQVIEQEKDLDIFIEATDDGFILQSVGNMSMVVDKEAI